jgi:hypothetical protein
MRGEHQYPKGEEIMRRALLLVGSWVGLAMLLPIMASVQLFAASEGTKQQWAPNHRNRPVPSIINPGTPGSQAKAGAPPPMLSSSSLAAAIATII